MKLKKIKKIKLKIKLNLILEKKNIIPINYWKGN